MHQMQQRGGGRGEAKHPLVGKKCLGGGGRGGLLLLASRTPFIGGGGERRETGPAPFPLLPPRSCGVKAGETNEKAGREARTGAGVGEWEEEKGGKKGKTSREKRAEPPA